MSEINRPTIENKPSPSEIAEATDGASLAENSNAKSVCASCEVTAMMVYDNEYNTPVWGVKHNLYVDDEEVISKVTLTAEEVTPAKVMGTTSYKYEPSFFPPAKVEVELVDTKPMTLAEINTEQEKIYKKIDTFYVDIETLFNPWTKVWKIKGWRSIPDAFDKGSLKGYEAWKKDEIDFWKSMGGAIESAFDATGDYLVKKANTGIDTDVNIGDNWLADAIEVPIEGWILLINMASGVTADAIDGVSNGFNAVVNFLDATMDFLKALATGSADGMMKALEALGELESGDISKIANEIFEALKDASNEASKGLAALLELMGRTAVVERLAMTLGAILLLMTPNFLAEMAGAVAGYVIPTIVAGIIFTIISALLSAIGIGEALFVSRIAKYMKDLKAILARLKKGIGAIFIKIFDFIEEIFGEIGKLFKKLMESPTRLVMHPSDKPYTGWKRGAIGGGKKTIVRRVFKLQNEVQNDIKKIRTTRLDTSHLGVKKEEIESRVSALNKKIKLEEKKGSNRDEALYKEYIRERDKITQYKAGVKRLKDEKGVSKTMNSDGVIAKKSYLNIHKALGDMKGARQESVLLHGKKTHVLVIDNLTDYMDELVYLYDKSENPLNSKMKKAIMNHIQKYEREVDGKMVSYLPPKSNPGLHAEVQAMNAALIRGESEVILATHQLVNLSHGRKIGDKFPACIHCTGILKHFTEKNKLQITTDVYSTKEIDIYLP